MTFAMRVIARGTDRRTTIGAVLPNVAKGHMTLVNFFGLPTTDSAVLDSIEIIGRQVTMLMSARAARGDKKIDPRIDEIIVRLEHVNDISDVDEPSIRTLYVDRNHEMYLFSLQPEGENFWEWQDIIPLSLS